MRKAILHLKRADPVMAAIISRAGPCQIQYREPTFQTLVRSIVYQQLSGKAALTIFNRLVAAAGAAAGRAAAGALGDPLTPEVTPEAILALRPARMRKLGLSKQKLTYIRELARMTRGGKVDFGVLPDWEDSAIVEHLTRVKGVGVWTVQMFLIFALRRANVLPTGDLGVRAAMKKAYGLSELPKPAEMERIAATWHPYCSVATWYLWRSLDNQGAM